MQTLRPFFLKLGQAMSSEIKSVLKFIALAIVGFTVNFSLTAVSAPDHTDKAILVGLLLTSFGMAAAIFAMQIVTLPFAVLTFLWRILVSGKPLTKQKKSPDKIERFGRALFILVYLMVSTTTGAFVGAIAGGMGIFSTAVLFAMAGVLLAWFVPDEFIWSVEGGDAAVGLDDAAQADLAIARKNGDPAVRLSDAIVEKIVSVVVDGTGSENRKSKP